MLVDPDGKQVVTPFIAPPPPLVPGPIGKNKNGSVYYRPGIPFPLFDTRALVGGFNRQTAKSSAIILGFTIVAVEGFKEVFNGTSTGLSVLFSDKLKPQTDYKGNKKHGIKWKADDAISRAIKEKTPQGKWGNEEDLNYAGEKAATLQPGKQLKNGNFSPGEFQDFPINQNSTSTVYYPDGTQSKPDKMRLRNNGDGKFYGFPIDSKTAKPLK